jgi:uroporphyrinogen-III decarboxylase
MEAFSQLSCVFGKQERISPRLIGSAGIEPRHIYTRAENIVAVAQKSKAYENNGLVILPFCHTVEAKALGADICPADDTAGPRPGAYTRASLEDFPEVEIARAPDVEQLLKACGVLSEAGENVLYQVSGPISILSCLMDLSAVFKTWRKSPETAEDVCEKLRRMLMAYCRELRKAGVGHIAYADPAGAPHILGPQYTRLLTARFTLPFLRELAAECREGVYLTVCPLTVSALAQIGAISEAAGGEGLFDSACIKSVSPRPEKNIAFV